MKRDESQQPTVCRSDFEIATLLDAVQIDGWSGIKSLPAAAFELDSADADLKAQRAELITAVRSGKHLELAVNAITWRQRPAPNRRGLRLAPGKLADRVSSWRGKPFLVDHNTYRVMEASKGTILSSKLIEESARISSFQQQLQVVKPDAVIGFLDGTLRSFSIAWFALGDVMCTVHGVNVLGMESCGCWPLETVMVDGKPKVVEYEFQDYEGKETSGVVVGAVSDTSVEGVRQALSAELSLHPKHHTRTRPQEPSKMRLTKLAAALMLTALEDGDEDRAVAAVTALRERAATAELEAGTQRAEVARLTAELAVQTALATTAAAAAIDSLIADAYKSGRLAYGKDAEGKNTPDPIEPLLRDFAKASGAAGRDKLAAKLTEMPVRVPIGQPAIANSTPEPKKPELRAVPDDAQLAAIARQMGVSVNDVRAQYGLPALAAGGAK